MWNARRFRKFTRQIIIACRTQSQNSLILSRTHPKAALISFNYCTEFFCIYLYLLQCGRGPNRKECCTGFYCNIAPDDSYAYCDEEVTCGTQGEFVSTKKIKYDNKGD